MVVLKYFGRSDFKQLMNWIDSPEFLLQWGGPQFDFPLNEKQLEKYIENANNDNSNTFMYKVIHIETGNVIGHIR
jgi:RimJ/RimL family protein N-acetyltransferase